VQIEGNPCDGLRLKDIEMRVHIETTEEGHAVSMGCFGPKNRNIVTYDSTTLETELSMVVGKMRATACRCSRPISRTSGWRSPWTGHQT
jgi:hypothetical protein